MTYADLLAILLNWQKLGHISYNEPVTANINGDIHTLDITESLTTGEAEFIAIDGDYDAS